MYVWNTIQCLTVLSYPLYNALMLYMYVKQFLNSEWNIWFEWWVTHLIQTNLWIRHSNPSGFGQDRHSSRSAIAILLIRVLDKFLLIRVPDKFLLIPDQSARQIWRLVNMGSSRWPLCHRVTCVGQTRVTASHCPHVTVNRNWLMAELRHGWLGTTYGMVWCV